MVHSKVLQPAFLLPEAARFPSTRYQGSKAKLADWIWRQIADLDFETCLDAFGGTGSVAYRLKQAGKVVTYNDILKFNYHIGVALIANSTARLGPQDVENILCRHSHIHYPVFIQNSFHDVYFTDAENAWLDQTITNISLLNDSNRFSLAFFALCQACIVKRPYNLFHRKNLYVRFADVERSFGNKASWDRPFDEWFRMFVEEANQAVFENGKVNSALNLDAIEILGDFDLVYIDTPYIPKSGVGVDYLDFYHFLEGLALYDEWDQHVDRKSKHLRFKPRSSEWTDKSRIYAAFDRLFGKYHDSVLVVSYRSDGIPSVEELIGILRRYKPRVRVEHYGQYKYALSTNGKSEEILVIGQ
ncbi:MAG: DNA adenine methylase [Chloroflexi bacterium]|nr:DNA adenine methylase [Chloroflexota bacterium]